MTLEEGRQMIKHEGYVCFVFAWRNRQIREIEHLATQGQTQFLNFLTVTCNMCKKKNILHRLVYVSDLIKKNKKMSDLFLDFEI